MAGLLARRLIQTGPGGQARAQRRASLRQATGSWRPGPSPWSGAGRLGRARRCPGRPPPRADPGWPRRPRAGRPCGSGAGAATGSAGRATLSRASSAIHDCSSGRSAPADGQLGQPRGVPRGDATCQRQQAGTGRKHHRVTAADQRPARSTEPTDCVTSFDGHCFDQPFSSARSRTKGYHGGPMNPSGRRRRSARQDASSEHLASRPGSRSWNVRSCATSVGPSPTSTDRGRAIASWWRSRAARTATRMLDLLTALRAQGARALRAGGGAPGPGPPGVRRRAAAPATWNAAGVELPHPARGHLHASSPTRSPRERPTARSARACAEGSSTGWPASSAAPRSRSATTATTPSRPCC